jgi:uncharacterized protein with von Willebrand factor type A (vWA) domain
VHYRYSRWDQGPLTEEFDSDDLMEALSDDLLTDGDVWSALQRVNRWGLHYEGHQITPGMQSLVQQLHAQRQQELEKYSLNSLMEDIKSKVADVVRTEREGMTRRLDTDGRQEEPGVEDMLRKIVDRKRSFLDGLSEDAAEAVTALHDYEFLDEEARRKFDALLERLQQHVLQAHSESIQHSLQGMKDGNLADLKNMLHDLNSLLRAQIEGDDTNFSRFLEKHGPYFPGAKSLDQLIREMSEQSSYMESLLQSMAPETRQSLEALIQSVLRDPELREEIAQAAEALEILAPSRRPRAGYPFSGESSITLEEALRLMRRMHDLEQLEKDFKYAQESGNLEPLNGEQIQELMGEDASQVVSKLKRLTQMLEKAGYVEKSGKSLTLTARGVRRIGQKAVEDIFRNLKHDSFGRHPIALHGAGGDRVDETKSFEFGDAFLLDMQSTLMNCLRRTGGSRPLSLATRDFEVFQTEQLARSSTVLMLDMSRSMPLRGCFVAAKKVAFALNSLMRTKFPRDRLYIVGFSDYARELRPEALHNITWGDYVYGTNMQHGFMLARRLLGRNTGGNRHIILITDGEPTAHFEGDKVHFAYPPTFRTFQETLREVKRCTQEGIVINTFMLERSHYLADFVSQMARINRGRAFFATPERLGDYVLVDYVASKRTFVRDSLAPL